MNEFRNLAILSLFLCILSCVSLTHAAPTTEDNLLSPSKKSEQKEDRFKPLHGKIIQAAINKAKDGSVVTIMPGTYALPGPLLLENRSDLTIRFIDVTFKTIDVNESVFQINNCKNINIIDGHFQHFEPLENYECDGPVFSINSSSNIKIMGSEINGCGAIGVSAFKTNKLVVFQCHLHHNTFTALSLNECQNVDINNNLIEHNGQTYNGSDNQYVRFHGNHVVGNKKSYWGNSEYRQLYIKHHIELQEPKIQLLEPKPEK